jgi:hypothetical protein
MDATELLFLGYAKTLKTFTSRRQSITKMVIAQIFMEQEIEQEEAQEHQSAVSAPSSTTIRFLSPVDTSSDSHNPIIIYASEDTAAYSSSGNSFVIIMSLQNDSNCEPMVYEKHTAQLRFPHLGRNEEKYFYIEK